VRVAEVEVKQSGHPVQMQESSTLAAPFDRLRFEPRRCDGDDSNPAGRASNQREISSRGKARSSAFFPTSVTRVPYKSDAAAGFPDRRHRVALDASAPHNRPEPCAHQEHNDDQPPHAEAQVSSPGT
jgi:hypothetical protein